MNRRKLVDFSCVGVLAVLHILFLVFAISFLNSQVPDSGMVSKLKEYKYLEANLVRNETSTGVVTLFEGSLRDDFLSHNDFESKKRILISQFGSEEYECFGNCYCDELGSRKSTSLYRSSLAKGVIYFLAAVSSSVAFSLAREYFSKECKERYSEQCSVQSINFDVEQCKNLVEEGIHAEDEEDSERGVRYVYHCYGNCVERKNHGYCIEEIVCTQLKADGEVYLYSNEVLGNQGEEPVSEKVLKSRLRAKAKKRFHLDFLRDFCKKLSKVEIIPKKLFEERGRERTFQDYGLKPGAEHMYRFDLQVLKWGYKCAGMNGGSLRNVKCRQLVPKPTARNSLRMDQIWWQKKKEWEMEDFMGLFDREEDEFMESLKDYD